MRDPATKNRNLGLSLLAIVLGMVCLAYASVPLYDLFCRVTGTGGTTQEAIRFPTSISGRTITVRFNADVSPELPWHFAPQQIAMDVKIGENGLAFYTAKNLSNTMTYGTATYNVTPHKAGIYFNKVKCFCFERQPLQAGQETDMPVSFFIDPEFLNDPAMADVDTVTLSYTFFPAKKTP